MDTKTTLIVIIGLTGVVVAIAASAWFVWKTLFEAFGGVGSWDALASRYGTDAPPPADALTRQTVRVGRWRYLRCTTAGVDPDGLYLSCELGLLSPGGPVLIPWEAVLGVERIATPLGPVYRLSVGYPVVATVTVGAEVHRRAAMYLGAGEPAGRPAIPAGPSPGREWERVRLRIRALRRRNDRRGPADRTNRLRSRREFPGGE